MFAPGLAEIAGHDIPAAGNAPVLLDDPGAVWLVLKGHADAFAVTGRDGRISSRRYLWSADAGQALPGCASEAGAGASWIGVGMPGTVLRRVRMADLEALAARPEGNATVVPVIDSLVTGLATALAPASQPPYHAMLEAGETLSLPAGRRAGVRHGVLFVRHETGRSLLAETGEPSLGAECGPLPLARGLWLTAAGDETRLAAEPTSACLARGEALHAVRLLVDLTMRWVKPRIEADEAGEQDRQRRKAAAEAAMRERGLRALGRLLQREPAEEISLAGGELLAACRIVGRAAGIVFNEPPRDAPSYRDPLELVCRASRVRSRRVALRDAWWKKDAGPLLGTLEEDGRPVALLPASGGYRLIDPRDPLPRSLDEESASQLSSFAESFYKPLPDRPLTPLELFRVGGPDMRADLTQLALAAGASGILALMLPLATGQVFSQIVPAGEPRNMGLLFAALVASALGAALFDVARAFLVVRIEGRWTATLQAALIDRLLGLPAPFFRRYPVGDLAQRAAAVNAVMSLLSGATVISLLSGVFSATNLGLLFYYDKTLAMWAVVILLAAAAAIAGASAMSVRIERRLQDAQGRSAGLVFQMLSGLPRLRVAGAEGRAFAVWCEAFGTQKALAFQSGLYQTLVKVFSEVLPIAAAAVLFAAAGFRLIDPKEGQDPLLTGDFVAFSAAFGAFLAAGLSLSNTLVGLLVTVPLMERVRPVLEAVPEQTASKSDPGPLAGRIEATHVFFRYSPDGPLILDDVSFRAEPGEFIAFVGPSGSGKSTTLRLLLGFEQPEAGSLSFDGRDMTTLDLTALRSQQMGVVLQNSRILSGDIFHNIIGSARLTVEDAWDAAERAGFADDIREMPMGMHTHLSEGGTTLSGGQRQRLLIARALVRKPRIILFDEATSALDNRTQEQVTRTLELTSATRVVIAHRLSTIRRADRIYVFERGRVVQDGRYDALAGAPGLFARLAARQQV